MSFQTILYFEILLISKKRGDAPFNVFMKFLSLFS